LFVGLDDPAWDPGDFYGALRVSALRIPSPRDLDPLLLGRLVRISEEVEVSAEESQRSARRSRRTVVPATRSF